MGSEKNYQNKKREQQMKSKKEECENNIMRI